MLSKKLLNTAEQLYYLMPCFIQNWIIQLRGAKIQKLRFGTAFHNTLSEYQNHLQFSEEELKNYQNSELSKALINAIKSPYWVTQFQKYGVEVNADNAFTEIAKLPILGKQDTKTYNNEIVIKTLDEKIIDSTTGGTTGTAVYCPQTETMLNRQWAAWWRYRIDNGIEFGTWCAWFAGKVVVPSNTTKPPFWRVNIPGKQLMFSALHLSKKNAPLYFDQLKSKKIPWIHGYPSQISLLASYFEGLNLSVWPELRLITFASETLLPIHEKIISRVFKVPYRQHYGLMEGVANISQMKDGVLRSDDDFSYTELIPLEGSTSYCRIIGTNFSNHAFPLFRYDTGDIAKVKYNANKEPVILGIEGRVEDYLALPNGNRFGPFSLIAKDLTNVLECQMIQKTKDKFILKVVKGSGYGEKDENNIRRVIDFRMSCKVDFSIDYIDKIPRAKSGKLRAVVSEI